MTSPTISPWGAVRLVAGREVSDRLRTKSFLVSNGIMLVLILGGIIAVSIFSGGDDDPATVGVVGGGTALTSTLEATGDALGTPVSSSDVADGAAARAAVTDGTLDVALVPGGDGGVTAITTDGVDEGLRVVLDTAVTRAATDTALAEQGVDPAVLTSATAAAVVTEQALDPPAEVDGQRLALAYVSVLLLYVLLLVNGLAVAGGVVEEKTSRVVEVLLSTLKPVHLLVGKVVGIGLVGLVQLAAIGAVGLGAALGTGLIEATGTAAAVFVSTLGWFILGYAFFSMLYAATGSMVSRQEEIASTTTPLTFLVLGMFFLAQYALQDPSSTLIAVTSWIPPFSAILMPLRIAAGVADPVQVVGTVVLMTLAVVGLSGVAAKIYQRSVLRSGTRVSWKEALSFSRG